MRPSRRTLGGGLLVLVVVGVAVFAATGGFSGGNSGDAVASNSTATTTVQRRDLVEVDEESGTLGYSDGRDVVNRLDGTITWLPVEGHTVGAGHSLFQVDGSDVVLLDGTVPAWRVLSSATSDGRDVGELERNLRALGYDHDRQMTIDGSWDSGTTQAVKRFQKAHGLDQTGRLELGRVVFLPGARRVGSVDATLGGSAAQTGASAGATAPASFDAGQSQTRDAVYVAGDATGWQVVDAAETTDTTTAPVTTTTAPATTPAPTTTTTPSPTTTAPATATTPPTTTAPATTAPSTQATPPTGAASAGAARAAPSGGLGGASAASGGGGGGASPSSGGAAAAPTASTIMTTTSGRKQVTVQLPTTKQSLARFGRSVSVELPGNAVVKGTVASVGKVATATSSGSSSAGGGGGAAGGGSSAPSTSATVTVHIRLRGDRGSALDQAPVTVRFEQSRVRDALAVPVTALIAQPGGRYAVQVVSGAGRRLVAVKPGVYTSGYVQISGDVQPGATVTNASETA